ncbi:hypothetical protein K1X76_07685 [bacterium]|nr:hypothetical protein [bacterium]
MADVEFPTSSVTPDDIYPWEDPALAQSFPDDPVEPDFSDILPPESPVDTYTPAAPKPTPQTSVASTTVFDEPPLCEVPATEETSPTVLAADSPLDEEDWGEPVSVEVVKAKPIVAYAGTMQVADKPASVQVRVEDVDPGYSAGDIIVGSILTIGGVAFVVLAAPAEITAGGVITVVALGSLLVGGSGCNNTDSSDDASTDADDVHTDKPTDKPDDTDDTQQTDDTDDTLQTSDTGDTDDTQPTTDTDVDTQDTDDTDVIIPPDYSNIDIDGDLYLDESSLTADQLAQFRSQGFIENAYGDVVRLSGDCDDTDATINPGVAEEPYDGTDNDCDAVTSDDDVDGDGHTALAVGGDDHDDRDPLCYYGAIEIPYDGIDQDGDGEDLIDIDQDGVAAIVAGGTDPNDENSAVWRTLPLYPDADQDGYASGPVQLMDVGEIPLGYSETSAGSDCNDTLAYVNPGPNAFQRVNGIDTNCDGTTAPNLASDAVMLFGEGIGDAAGFRAIALGDVDGDGYDDVLVGSASNDAGPGIGHGGAAYVWYGSPDFFTLRGAATLANADVKMSASMASENFGGSVVAYDLDGAADGNNTRDLIVGAPGHNNSAAYLWDGLGDGSGSGAIMIFHGGSLVSTSAANADATIVGAQNETIGLLTYAFDADVNGDNLGEIVTAVNPLDGRILDFIPARAYSGTIAKDSVRTLRFRDNVNFVADWANHVAIGDVDGDGYGDILLGDSIGYNNDGRGQAILIYGSPTLPPIIEMRDLNPASGIEYRTFTGNSPNAGAGSAVDLRDVDGDGLADIIIGAEWDETGGAVAPHGGVTYTVYAQDFEDARSGLGALDLTANGSETVLDGDVDLLNGKRVYSTTPNGELPAAVTAGSDTNGDGINDLLMASNNFGANGAAFYMGGHTLATAPGPAVDVATAQQITDASLVNFGTTVTGGGDIDGDGNQDILINDASANRTGVVVALSGGASY